MKTLVIILSTIGLLSLNSCSQRTDTNSILKNSESRREVMNNIAENHDYMTEFMEHMHKSPHAMQMMQGNKLMMGTMMRRNGMEMMMADTTMMKNTMETMLGNLNGRHLMMNEFFQDDDMMTQMIQLMHRKGMISKSCMENAMKSKTSS